VWITLNGHEFADVIDEVRSTLTRFERKVRFGEVDSGRKSGNLLVHP